MQFMTIHNSKVNKSDIDDTLFRWGEAWIFACDGIEIELWRKIFC